MRLPTNDTAILFFSRSAGEECRHKRFVPEESNGANIKICRTLISSTRSLIDQSDLPVFTVGYSEQQGTTFGQRFSNALQMVFGQGYEKVIAIGNDCPLLSLKDIHETALHLHNGNNVLGPTIDGGIYLLGIRKNCFNIEKFANLGWQSSRLFVDIVDYFNIEGAKPHLLKKRRDIDGEADLWVLVRKHSKNPIIKALKEIVYASRSSKNTNYIDPNFVSQFHQSLGLRGPPTY